MGIALNLADYVVACKQSFLSTLGQQLNAVLCNFGTTETRRNRANKGELSSLFQWLGS